MLKVLGEGLRDFSDVGSLSRMPSFNMISSCGKGGKAPGGSVSNVRGKNQISLDISCFLQLLSCFLLLTLSQFAKSINGLDGQEFSRNVKCGLEGGFRKRSGVS